MAYVFISYRRNDNLDHLHDEIHFAHQVVEYLNSLYGAGFCFMDTQQDRGKWHQQLKEEITKSSVFLLFLSPNCLDYRDGEDMFRFEIQEALNQEKTIVPVQYVACSDEAGERLRVVFSPPPNDILYGEIMKHVGDYQTIFFDPCAGERGYSSTLASIADKVAEPVIERVFSEMRQQADERLEKISKDQFGTTPFDTMLLAPVAVENTEKRYDDLYQAIDGLTSLIPSDPILLTAKGGQGKSSQMIRCGQTLLSAADNDGRKNCVVCYFHLYALDTFQDNTDLIDKMLDAMKVHPAMHSLIKKDIASGKKGRRYFLLLDGLDEIKSEHPVRNKIRELSSPDGQAVYQNLQIIVAGRCDLQRVFGANSVINMRLENLKREKMRQWLENKKGKCVNIEAYNGIIDSPMLLLLACESENPQVRNHIERWMENKKSIISKGEVLWNYTEYLLCKLSVENVSDVVKESADKLIHYILPFIAYNCYFLHDSMEATITDVEIAITEDREMLEILTKHFPGLIRPENNNYTFSHRLFRDYFAMVHVANTYKKLLYGELKDDDQDDYDCLFHRRFLEAPEYSDLLVSILPGVLKKNKNLEQSTVEQINKIQMNNRYSEKSRQYICMLSCVYPFWVVKAWLPYYKILSPEEKTVLSTFVCDAYGGIETTAKILDNTEDDNLLTDICISFIFCVLSQVYRSGSLLMGNLEITHIPKVKVNLNKSLYYAMKAQELYNGDYSLIDGFNFVGKAYNSARENLLNRKREKKEIVLLEDDLFLTDELLTPIATKLTREIRKEIISVKPGSVLTVETAERRIKVLWSLAEYWLNKSAQKECALSLNLLALMDEMLQEEKVEKERNYINAFQIYIKGSTKNHPASPYSAMKASQMLAQGKVGLDSNGNACLLKNADPQKTVEKAIQLHEIALAGGGYWGHVALSRGQLYMRYGLDLDCLCPLTRENAVQEAYMNFSLAFDQWKVILADIEWLAAGLELAALCPNMRGRIQNDLSEKVQIDFCNAFPKFAAGVKVDRHADKWTPSIWVFKEYCQRIRNVFVQYKDIIEELPLTDLMDQWLTCINNQEMAFNDQETKHG